MGEDKGHARSASRSNEHLERASEFPPSFHFKCWFHVVVATEPVFIMRLLVSVQYAHNRPIGCVFVRAGTDDELNS